MINRKCFLKEFGDCKVYVESITPSVNTVITFKSMIEDAVYICDVYDVNHLTSRHYGKGEVYSLNYIFKTFSKNKITVKVINYDPRFIFEPKSQ